MAGCDMCFSYAEKQFERQEDVLARAIPIAGKQNPQVHVVYSTPACYVQALHEASRTWPSFSDDLLPYSDLPGRTWTGFYTTRPNLKMFIRYANGFLQACKQLSLYGRQDASERARQLGEAVATVQHHDGVTGTCSNTAAGDYTNRLLKGVDQCEGVISTSLASLLNLGASNAAVNEHQLHFCHLVNQSECQLTETLREFTVIVYNPASVSVSPYVRLPLGTSDRSGVTVSGPDGARTDSQVLPLASHGHGIPESKGRATTSLVFRANVEPLGASLYSVQYEAPVETAASKPYFVNPDVQSSFIENERYRVEWNPQTGLVSAVVLKGPGSAVKLRQAFAAYLIEPEQLNDTQHRPGHYTFSGYGNAREIRNPNIRVVKGHLVQEIHQSFTGYVSQVISLHKDSPFIEFTWTVGPLTQLMQDMGRNRATGCDVISKFQSDLQSDGFYTDNNGWRNMHRTLTFQDGNLPIPANYHPVVSWIYIEDQAKDLQMMILPDRAEGGTSTRQGHLELMIHRRHSTNDELGLPEILQEDGVDGEGVVARGTHRLFLGSSSEARQLMRLQALQLVYRPVILVSPGEWVPKKDAFSTLKSPLPSTVHVLTLERLSESQVLLRLEHLAVTDDAVEVNVTRLLAGYRLDDVKPVTLGANQYLPGPTRYSWPTSGADSPERVPDLNMPPPQTSTVPETGDTIVKLAPGEIASFLAQLAAE
ncbi:lysosomal alpha-mannosidase-like [Dermacentor variabilis]|uniref:lysosomal alpha-mannosidase-like n=1 Tax=Dermacentor variabilis TaxID=34621 RepID=UPI003F5C51B2